MCSLALGVAILPACKARAEKSGSAEPAPAKAPESAAPAPPVLVPEGTNPELTVQASRHGLVLADRDGKQTVRVDTRSGKAPEDWPSEAPLYPGGKVQMSMKLGRGATLTLETSDAIPKVLEYYQTQLAGMPQSSTVDTGKSQTRIWSDPSKPLQITVTVSAERGVTKVTLIVTRERGK